MAVNFWDDYSPIDATPSPVIQISERTRALLLNALSRIDRRFNWDDGDDDTLWDEIEGQLANSYNEVMLDVTISNVPVGAIVAWGDYSPPIDWLVCDGALLEQADYPALFAVIGLNFNAAPPSGQFQLPDLSERVIRGNEFGNLADIGNVGGADSHSLTIAEMPAHFHNIGTGGAVGGLGTSVVRASNLNSSQNTSSQGSGTPFSIIPSHVVMKYIIKVL